MHRRWQTVSMSGIDTLAMPRRGPDRSELSRVLGPQGGVVVLAPHPDDESLGCGALLAACFNAGRPAHVVLLTDGSASHPGSGSWPAQRLAQQRRAEATEAICRLGGSVGNVTFLGLADGAVPSEGADARAAVAEIRRICIATDAATLLSTGPADAHADHRATAAIAAGVVEALPGLRVLHYPIWPPEPQVQAAAVVTRFPQGDHRKRKALAVAAHLSQLGGLITDDPEGFVLPPDFVARFLDRDEVFVEPQDAICHT